MDSVLKAFVVNFVFSTETYIIPMLGFLENQSKFTHALSNMESLTPETVALVCNEQSILHGK